MTLSQFERIVGSQANKALPDSSAIRRRVGLACSHERVSSGIVVRRPSERGGQTEAVLLPPVRHRFLDIASELPEMNGQALVKLALLPIRRAPGDLLRIVGFCA